MRNTLVRGLAALLMATGVFVTTAAAAPPKIQLQYLAFPGTCVGGSTGSMQLVVVNNGPTGSVAGSDHVLVSVPLGSVADDLLATTTGLSCGAESALWRCTIDSITATAAIVRLYPATGTVPVNAGETLYFYLDNAQINSSPGMAMLDVTQNIDPSRATTPVNTQMSVLKVTSTAAAYLEIDPTVPANLKDGVDWSELTGMPSGFSDGIDNVGLAAETDPTVPANIKDGIAWSEISGIPASLQDGDQEGITTETDPQVGSNTTNRVPKWDGSALVSSSSINENASGNVGIGTASPQSKLDVAGDTKVSGVLTSGKIQVVDVVTEGSNCSPNGLVARDETGMILSCQSGAWAKASGAGGGTGLSGVFAPLKGMQISCYYAGTGSTLYGMVDSSGKPWVRCIWGLSWWDKGDTGWVSSVRSVQCAAWGTLIKGDISTTGIFMSYDGTGDGKVLCSEQWPNS